MGAGDWERVELRDVVKVREERLKAAEAAAQSLPIVEKISFAEGLIHLREAKSRTDLIVAEPGDLVISGINALKGAIAINDTGHRIAATIHYSAYAIDDERVLPTFLVESLRSTGFREEAIVQMDAGVKTEVKPKRFLPLELDLPPLEEQHRIVHVMDAADEALDAAREERYAAFDALRAAVEALIVPRGTWDDLPEEWELKELGDVADVRSGITKGRKTEESVEAVRFLRAANVQDGYLDLGEIKTIDVTATERLRFRLQAGDVLMVEGGNAEHLGRGWIWNDEIAGCLHQNHVFRARPNTGLIEPRFLAYVIAASPARAYCFDKAKKTTNLASINKTQISALSVPVPPLQEQRNIVATLDAIRAAAVEATRAHHRLRELRESLVDALLTGERRVGALRVAEEPAVA